MTGIWLAGAGIGLGSPIPTRIADQLRGREFSSFDAFRKAFWVEVGNDSELSRQFNQDNIKRLVKGLAPTTRVRDQITAYHAPPPGRFRLNLGSMAN
ncbi:MULTISPECIES: hypothetical protein [unclassified Pseudomonas]|uniref:hypothetical protein n=1 Tax=unclassified Pseudomonas TaxID=196821 RepID=UPI002B236F4F|nr:MULTISPECIES: hypothetical protein [unclassified Pseudomonas]